MIRCNYPECGGGCVECRPRLPPSGKYPGGTIAFFEDAMNCWHVCKPHSPAFSSVTMVATHYFNGSFWEPIHDS